MCINQKIVNLGFTDEKFPAGTHMCMIYNSEEERQRIISKFIENGLSAGEKVGYFADMLKPDNVQEWLENMGVNIPKGEEAEQFNISVAETTYCPHGTFDPEEMLDTLRSYYKKAMDSGFTGARVSGEMSWALRNIPGTDRLVEYEALINEISEKYPVTPICQYDVNRFDGATIFDILKVHPYIIAHGQVVRNPYYMNPQEFLRTHIKKE